MLKVIVFIFALLLSLSVLANLYDFFTKPKARDKDDNLLKSFLIAFAFLIIPWGIFYIVCTDWFTIFLDKTFDIITNIVTYGILIFVSLVALAIIGLIIYSSYEYAIERKFIIWENNFHSRFISILKSILVIIIGAIIGLIVSAILFFVISFLINFFSSDPLRPY